MSSTRKYFVLKRRNFLGYYLRQSENGELAEIK